MCARSALPPRLGAALPGGTGVRGELRVLDGVREGRPGGDARPGVWLRESFLRRLDVRHEARRGLTSVLLGVLARLAIDGDADRSFFIDSSGNVRDKFTGPLTEQIIDYFVLKAQQPQENKY